MWRGDRAEALDEGRLRWRLDSARFHPGEDAPRGAHGGVGCGLSTVWPGAPQGVRDGRPPGSLAAAWPLAAAPVFVRTRSRCRLLVRRGRADSAAAGRDSALNASHAAHGDFQKLA